MYANWKKSLLWALALTVVLSTAAAGKGKPPKDPPPEPPPVLYELRLFSMPGDYAGGTVAAFEMNNLGEVVGQYPAPNVVTQPFYIDVASTASVATNLNDLELDPLFSVPGGWYIYRALGINNLGDIVGTLALSSDPAVWRGFVLELRPDSGGKPRLHLIPEGTAWSRPFAMAINDVGEILGRGDDVTGYIYRASLHGLVADTTVQILPFLFNAWNNANINNPTADHGTQIMANAKGLPESPESPFLARYTLGDDAPEILLADYSVRVRVRGLSDSGSFCGHRSIEVEKKGKNRRGWTAIGYWYDWQNDIFHDLPDVGDAYGINADDDVVAGRSGEAVLYHSRLGALKFSEIVVAANEFEQQLWIDSRGATANLLTERGIVGTDPSDPLAEFPAMAGRLRRFDMGIAYFYEVFVLLPLATP